MKKYNKLLLKFFLIFTFFFVSASLYVLYFSKDHIETYMQNAFNREVDIDRVNYQFPFGVKADGVTIGGLLKAKKIKTQLSPKIVFDRSIILSSLEIFKSEIDLGELAQSYTSSTWEYVDRTLTGNKKISSSTGKADQTAQIIVKKFVLSDGKFDATNWYLKDEDKFLYGLQNLNLKFENLQYPFTSRDHKFKIDGTLIKKPDVIFDETKFAGEGVVNFVKKDLDARFKTYGRSKYFDIELIAKAVNNNLKVDGNLKFNAYESHLVKQLSENNPSGQSILFQLLYPYRVTGNMEFSFESKLDDFRIDKVYIKGSGATRDLAREDIVQE